MTRALLPKLIDSGDGLVVTVTSIAAMEIYDGGSGYTAAKHAQGALHRTLRGELLGKPVRHDITEHHKDGNHDNNAIENRTLADDSCHRAYHLDIRRMAAQAARRAQTKTQ